MAGLTTFDHSNAINLDADTHPQYLILSNARGVQTILSRIVNSPGDNFSDIVRTRTGAGVATTFRLRLSQTGGVNAGAGPAFSMRTDSNVGTNRNIGYFGGSFENIDDESGELILSPDWGNSNTVSVNRRVAIMAKASNRITVLMTTGNMVIGSATHCSAAENALHLTQGEPPVVHVHTSLVNEDGELFAYDEDGNGSQLTDHANDAGVAAGIVINPDDPYPQIRRTKNAYIGKIRYDYLDPLTHESQTVCVDMPADQIRDWDADQLAIKAQRDKRIAEWEQNKQAHEEAQEDAKAEAWKRGEGTTWEPEPFCEKCPEPYVPREAPEWMKPRLAKRNKKKGKK
jgi:hypothetical protein